ncbi:MAG: nitrate/nitrite transporter [Sandaracinaceae bacterium]
MNDADRAFVAVSVGVLLAVSVWFTATAATPALAEAWGLSRAAAALLTTSTQLGFILGTLLYALANLADLFDARRVFFLSALLAALFNALFALLPVGLGGALALRVLTGITLAGVYPVGMKILAGWFAEGLGLRLGVMVGALTLGTALPYLLRAVGASFDWRVPVLIASGLAVVGGGLVVAVVRRGPHEGASPALDAAMLVNCFREREFRLAALGYFGHMWELYAFWAMTAAWLGAAAAARGRVDAPVAMLAFLVIGIGAVGSAAGGWLSARVGERRVALAALGVSGLLCAFSPLAFDLPWAALLAYVALWGVAVIADSAQFSALSARYAPPGYVGTALTIQNGIGFALTIVTIQAVPVLAEAAGWRWALAVLAPGPALGVLATLALPDGPVRSAP